MDFNKVVRERRSVRKFHTKKPDWRDIIEAFEVGLMAPTAGNIGSVRFLLVEDEEHIMKIRDACQQDFISEAKYVVVVCSDPADILRFYGDSGEVYVRQQAGAAIQNFLLKITELGLGACWVGAFVETQIKHLLKIPDNVYIEAVIPIGYSADKSPRKKRQGLNKSVFFHIYKNKKMKPKRSAEAK